MTSQTILSLWAIGINIVCLVVAIWLRDRLIHKELEDYCQKLESTVGIAAQHLTEDDAP